MGTVLYLLFFVSGAAGLIYEIVWSRMLVLVFGSTTNSIVAVVSAFLGGLAIGSLIAGKIASRFYQQDGRQFARTRRNRLLAGITG